MISNKFRQIEGLFLETFQKESDRINSDFRKVISSLYVYPPEGQPFPRNCCIGIDVVFQDADPDKTDNICLELYIDEHNRNLEMNLSVVWGHPTGERVGRMFSEAVEVTDENLNLVQEKLPDMIEKLRQSIQSNPNGK